jgi:hypothetical protein
MAKKQGKSSNVGLKRTFGVRRTGKYKKFRGPKEKPTKKYKGQGR